MSDGDKINKIVINEILFILIEKKGHIPLDNLVRIASDFYCWDEICVVKCKRVECGLDERISKRKIHVKEKLIVEDIQKIILDPKVNLPAYAALK